MKNLNKIPIPQLILNNCETDSRGLRVPFVVLKDKDGKHHFKINDSEKTIKCMKDQLCTICSTKMSYEDRWLVGGIASAFDKGGYYIDHPVHYECGKYALQVCPYLAIRNYNGKLDMIKLQEQFEGEFQLFNPTVDQDRLPFFVFIRPLNIAYFTSKTDLNDIKLKSLGPYHEVEIWDEGDKITDIEVIKKKLAGTKWEQYTQSIINFYESYNSRLSKISNQKRNS